MEKFFTPEEESRVVRAIKAAELNTSGEIRIHIEHNCLDKALVAAVDIFERLEMHRTKARNGVLIFIAPERKEFAILGDQGIDEVVPKNFWQEERDILLVHFKRGAFEEGIIKVVHQIGEKLKAHFPYQSDDINELPDEISYG